MDHRCNSSSNGADSNFTDILNRTRHNISRISSRYSTDALGQSAYSRPRTTSSFRDPYEVEKYNSSVGANSSLIRYQQEADGGVSETRQGPSLSKNDETTHSLHDMMERISKLEQGAQDRYRFEERMMKLETSVDSMRAVVESLVGGMREEKREVSKLSNQLSSQGATLDILQHDVDSRRR